MSKTKSDAYGIMAILDGGKLECSETHIDGWYYNRSDVQMIFELFKKRYPGFDVFVVKREQVEWRGCMAQMPDVVRKQI